MAIDDNQLGLWQCLPLSLNRVAIRMAVCSEKCAAYSTAGRLADVSVTSTRVPFRMATKRERVQLDGGTDWRQYDL